MDRISKFRATLVLLIFLLVLGFFTFELYETQIIETGGETDNSTTFTARVTVKAARGDILDRNGNLLVSNRASYDLMIYDQVLMSVTGTNNYLYQLVTACDAAGIEYTDHFPVTKERPFTYTLSEQSSAWQGYFQKYLAFKGGIDSDITAPLLVQELRERYRLPVEWTDEEARKVIGIYYELQLRPATESLPIYVFISDATDEELSTIVELNIPGMNVEPSTVREYNTKYAAHILGFVGKMSPDQWEYYKNIPGYGMDAEVGQDGLEKAYEEYLHGIDGVRVDTVTADGKLVKSVYEREPQAGANVEVSIDINLQMAAEDAMEQVIEDLRAQEKGEDGWDADGGAVVAMDVKTGQMLVSASYPSFDLSRYFEDFHITSKDERKPLYNRALLATYPPGSTYKMSMVVAAIDAKAINSETIIEDQLVFNKYDGFAVWCLAAKHGYSHGKITAAEALRDSCNYFFYTLGDMISLNAMDSTAKGLGLGEETGVELPEYIGHRANKESKADHNWYAGDQVLAAIGQSENRFSPAQLCSYVATLANQGKRYNATFMSRVVSADYRILLDENKPTIASTMTISDEAYNTVKEGMCMVASHPYGTAYATFKDYPIQVAAKTGTAQTGIDGTSDNGAFVCFAPADDPQIAIAVYVEKGGHGSTIAVIARAILDQYFDVGEIGDVITYENQLS